MSAFLGVGPRPEQVMPRGLTTRPSVALLLTCVVCVLGREASAIEGRRRLTAKTRSVHKVAKLHVDLRIYIVSVLAEVLLAGMPQIVIHILNTQGGEWSAVAVMPMACSCLLVVRYSTCGSTSCSRWIRSRPAQTGIRRRAAGRQAVGSGGEVRSDTLWRSLSGQ